MQQAATAHSNHEDRHEETVLEKTTHVFSSQASRMANPRVKTDGKHKHVVPENATQTFSSSFLELPETAKVNGEHAKTNPEKTAQTCYCRC
jgi:hypothetical protein